MQEAWLLLKQGGIVMIPLILSSILVVAIIIERSFVLRKKKILIPEIVNVIETIKKPEDVHLAISICQKKKGAFSSIVQLGLENKSLPKFELKELITDQGRQEVRTLEKGLVILETVAGIAPLLGLLGTVIGMIKVFDVISQQGLGQTQALSGGISQALITTVIGLSIGIPSLVVYNYFTDKAENLIMDIEKFTTQLLRKLSTFHAASNAESSSGV
ncbi:MotA/TolQ/ExbB proton channel family protein [candidate division KSB1 bacterium]|nr:MotA/TolQ/ExbB proton channel family protein [candidate division KSB1 bacterium]MBL7094650.1 MotA/TolQ/ExbB proton channel family protein [candidate division KSB1 bacterium]